MQFNKQFFTEDIDDFSDSIFGDEPLDEVEDEQANEDRQSIKNLEIKIKKVLQDIDDHTKKLNIAKAYYEDSPAENRRAGKAHCDNKLSYPSMQKKISNNNKGKEKYLKQIEDEQNEINTLNKELDKLREDYKKLTGHNGNGQMKLF